jgi:hypothetical protein
MNQAGLVTVTQQTATECPRVLVIVYAKNKQFLGLIPNSPDEFYNTLRRLGQQLQQGSF